MAMDLATLMQLVSALFCLAETQNLPAFNHGTEEAKCHKEMTDKHVHKEMTDKLSVVELANTFTNTEHRRSVFGTSTQKDL